MDDLERNRLKRLLHKKLKSEVSSLGQSSLKETQSRIEDYRESQSS